MNTLEQVLENLGESENWSTDGFGLESLLVCQECWTKIEQDCPACPECGQKNPLVENGLI